MLNPIFLLVGPPAVGKSSTSFALAKRFPLSLHIPVDKVRNMVVEGFALPKSDGNKMLLQQVRLARISVTQMALSYQQAGFAVVIDDFWDSQHDTDYEQLFKQTTVHRVILCPAQAEAHQRNYQRAEPSLARDLIDEGIRIVYQQLQPALPLLNQRGWVVLDSTHWSIHTTAEQVYQLSQRPS